MFVYGLVGYPLGHSFSKRYFTEKFSVMNIEDTHRFENFELADIAQLTEVVSNSAVQGLNVTIPHKQAVMPHLDELDPLAERIGAVNVIKITPDRRLVGYNSDYYGFRTSLERFLVNAEVANVQALILGNGGAAQAVRVALEDMGIRFKIVSRQASETTPDIISYESLTGHLAEYQVIINTTPLGTHPNIQDCPPIPYEELTPLHYLFDLVYNPETTLFMQKGLGARARVKNGYEMLVLQAEKAWEIWRAKE